MGFSRAADRVSSSSRPESPPSLGLRPSTVAQAVPDAASSSSHLRPVFSLLTLLHALHSHLLHSHLLSLPPALRPTLPLPTAHDRYTRSWARHSVLYRLASGALIGVGGVQLLGEMIALKGWASAGPPSSTPEARARGRRDWERRWRWLVGVEGTKCVLSCKRSFGGPTLTRTSGSPSTERSCA
jgi:hypothetical protein